MNIDTRYSNTNFNAKYLRPVKVELCKEGTPAKRTAALVELDIINNDIDFRALYCSMTHWSSSKTCDDVINMLNVLKKSLDAKTPYKFYALTSQKQAKSLVENPEYNKIQSIAAIEDSGDSKTVAGIFKNPFSRYNDVKGKTLNSILEEFKGTEFSVSPKEEDISLYENHGFKTMYPKSMMINPNK